MSGLFGTLGGASSASSQAPSPFAALSTSQPQQAASNQSPFGALSITSTSSNFLKPPPAQTQPDAAPARDLFAGLGTRLTGTSAPSSAPQVVADTTQPTGMFGAQTSQPQDKPLFPSLSSSTTQQPVIPSLTLNSTQLPAAPQFALPTTSTTTTQPSLGNLFKGLGGPQQPQQGPQPQASLPLGSLFPGLAGSRQPQQGPQSQFPSGQQAQQGSILQSSSSKSQPAYFDALLEKGRNRANGKSQGPDLEEIPSLQLGLPDISRQVRQLGGLRANAQQGQTDTRAHYLLAASGISPGAALRDLRELNAQPSTAGPVSAPAFDTDTGAYIANLQSQSTLALISESLNRSARDFDAFLERNVTMDWDAQRQRIYEHFGLMPKGETIAPDDGSDEESGRASFGRSTRFGRGQKANGTHRDSPLGRSLFKASNLQKSVLGSPGRAGVDQAGLFADVADKANKTGNVAVDDRFLREREGKYAEKVQQLNEARLQNKFYPILQEFTSAESESGGDQITAQLVNSYKALIEIVQEDLSGENITDANGTRERQFADDYLDEATNSAGSMRMKKRIIDGSRRFLEKLFFQELESLIARYPREARLGGVPTTINKVRAYVNLRASRKDLANETTAPLLQKVDDDYCWVLIFYLLRSGHVKEAVEYVTSNSTVFRAIDRNFPTYITNYYQDQDRRLRRDLQGRINAEYNQKVRVAPENSTDPYRLACYKIIGRCELDKRSLEPINRGVEDWIWLQFSLAREVNRVDEMAAEVFGLDEVRAVIREIGQRHFAKGTPDDAQGGHGTYVFLQMLGGMFEQAVAYLYPFNYVSAVHFAIVLDFYGLLRVSSVMASDSELLTFNTKQLPQISFGRMIGYYTGDFRSANVEAAIDYLTLLCLNVDLPGEAGKSQKALCHEALRELVLETREFAKLLGDVRTDGQRIKGGIEKRLKLLKLSDQEGEFLRTLTVQAAAVADDNGRITDAVLLYHLAEDYDSVISIINRALSESISIDIGQEPMRLQPLKPRSIEQQQQQQQQKQATSLSLASVDDPADLAHGMIGLYNQNALYYNKIKPINRDACGVLVGTSQAKQRVQKGQWAEALDIITSLNLLPLSTANNIHQIRQYAQTFNQLPHSLARIIPNLLTWTITCCTHQRDLLLSSGFEDPTRRKLADDLDVKARDLLVFAGLIRYHLPERVLAVLARAGGGAASGI